MAEIMGNGKTADFSSAPCRTHLPRTARATNSCTPHGGFQGGRRESSLMTFAADSVSATPFRGGSATLNPPLGHSKARKKKSFFMILYGGSKPYPVSATPTAFASQIGQFPPYDRAKVPSTAKTRNQIFHPLFLLTKKAQKKKLSKRKAPMKSFRTLRSATRATCPCPSRLLKKAGENFWVAGENFNYGALKLHYSARKL